jgi:hypothetical protein
VSDEVASTRVGVNRWVGLVGLFIAPTTVITSVCFFFGYISTRKYLSYFGIDSNAVGYTNSDYVLKSVSVLYAPILVLLVSSALTLWGIAYIRRMAARQRGTRLIRGAGWAAVVVGVALTLRGIVGVIHPEAELIHSTVLTPLTLGVGPMALVAGFWLLSTVGAETVPEPFTNAQRVSLMAAAAVVVMALFWLTNIFATAYGENEAKSTAAKLWSKETGVTLYTDDRLGAPSNLIVESVLEQTDSRGVAQPEHASVGTFLPVFAGIGGAW